MQALDYELLIGSDILRRVVDLVDGSQASRSGPGCQLGVAWAIIVEREVPRLPAVSVIMSLGHSFWLAEHCHPGVCCNTPLMLPLYADRVPAYKQLDSDQKGFWTDVLSRALHRLATAADPLIPWLAEEAAENTALIKGLRCGGLDMAQVRLAAALGVPISSMSSQRTLKRCTTHITAFDMGPLATCGSVSDAQAMWRQAFRPQSSPASPCSLLQIGDVVDHVMSDVQALAPPAWSTLEELRITHPPVGCWAPTCVRILTGDRTAVFQQQHPTMI